MRKGHAPKSQFCRLCPNVWASFSARLQAGVTQSPEDVQAFIPTEHAVLIRASSYSIVVTLSSPFGPACTRWPEASCAISCFEISTYVPTHAMGTILAIPTLHARSWRTSSAGGSVSLRERLALAGGNCASRTSSRRSERHAVCQSRGALCLETSRERRGKLAPWSVHHTWIRGRDGRSSNAA